MKNGRNSGFWLLLAAVMTAGGCASEMATERIRVEIPGKPEFLIKDAPEIILPGFWEEAGFKDVPVSLEINDHWKSALKREFKGRVTEKPVTWTSAEMLNSPEVWKEAGKGSPGAFILTGTATFSTETRKALIGTGGGKFEEPWDRPNAWAENRNFSLRLEISLLRADDGSVAFKREFRDSIVTENKKPTPAYILRDLLDRITPKLFSALFGTPRILERYLLRK
jgi:hypothetical protein